MEESKRGAKPDAEIMNTLYTEFGYSPLIFLDVERFYANETNKIWNGFTEDVREELEAVEETKLRIY